MVAFAVEYPFLLFEEGGGCDDRFTSDKLTCPLIPSRRRDSKHAGGVLLDSAVHFIAGLRRITGHDIVDIASVSTLQSSHLPQVSTFVSDGTPVL